MRVLILAAYLLAAILPLGSLGGGSRQSLAEHAQMMAMAGHVAQMPGMDGAADGAQQMLCQQHCLFGAAALPQSNRVAEMVLRVTVAEIGSDRLAASLAIPPPGPPPRFAVI